MVLDFVTFYFLFFAFRALMTIEILVSKPFARRALTLKVDPQWGRDVYIRHFYCHLCPTDKLKQKKRYSTFFCPFEN